MSNDVNRRRAAYWDKQAARYDREMDSWDRRLFGDSRPWVCGRATGDVLEVAVGTGRNFAFYPDGVRLTGSTGPRPCSVSRASTRRPWAATPT